MRHQAFVIFDSKAKIYNKPFYFVNTQTALRAAQDLVLDTTTEISAHPGDYAMFHIGVYDDETAQFEPWDKHDCICRFHELRQAITPPKKLAAELQHELELLQQQNPLEDSKPFKEIKK